MKVKDMTDLDVKRHQRDGWVTGPQDDVVFKLVCEKVRSWPVAQYRQYLEKVEERQGNVTDGFFFK